MIVQLDTENADRDLTSQVTVLTHTPNASSPMLCQGIVYFGDGTKNLDGTGGDFELTVTVGGQTVQPNPQTITFGTEVRSSAFTAQFPVPANAEVVLKAKSPNGADTDVDVTAYLYQVDAVDVVAVSGSSDAANNAEIVFDTDFATNYDTTNDKWQTEADMLAISGDTTAADNAEAFFDDTGFNASNSTIGTTTTNTDMRGTDSALLAASAPANFGDLSITVTTGLVDVNDKTGFALTAAYDDAKTAAQAGDAMDLVADAIKATTFDETTAYPLTSADTGATEVARTGADGDTLETLSDEIAGISGGASAADIADAVWDEALSGHTAAGSAGERVGRVPNAAAGGNGGLPTVDASNRVAGIQGTKNVLSDLNDIAAADVTGATVDTGFTVLTALKRILSSIQGQAPVDTGDDNTVQFQHLDADGGVEYTETADLTTGERTIS